MPAPPTAADIEPMRSRSQVALDIARTHPPSGLSGRGHKAPATLLGERLGITRATIARARRVLAVGDDDLIQQVCTGRLSVHAAWNLLRGRQKPAKARSRR